MSFSSPDKPNPFAEFAPNPYAAPTYQASGGPIVPFTREEARLRLLGPAIGLGLFSGLWLIYLAFVIITLLFDARRMPQPNDAAEAVGQFVGMCIAMAMFSIPTLITLFGVVQMIRVKGYPWCWAAAILGVVPCTFCFPFMIPFGIWGMVVLYDVRVKMAFYGGTNPFGAKYA